MAKCYFELRQRSARGSDSLAADIMRHLHTREYLGKALVICDQPAVTLSAARKQWLKLARVIQKQRASTLNADKILKYTHAIAHMQHLHFSSRSVAEDPDSDIYFLTAEQLHTLPMQCLTIYVTTPLEQSTARNLIAQLSESSLIVDYDHPSEWVMLGLEPKRALEQHVTEEWKQAKAFLELNDIDIKELTTGNIQDIEAMDDALDTLLSISHPFLQVANNFQHSLEVARPLRLNQQIRREYDAFSILAHRVQALSLETFTQRFLETYNEDDTFFLYDFSKGIPLQTHDNLMEIVNEHASAGRMNLAKALERLYMGRSLRPSMKPM
jgi:hypothetical protein